MKPNELPEIYLKFETPTQAGSLNLLRQENLSRLGICSSDIALVQTSFCHPGPLYTEEGVATKNHPCAGSSSAILTLQNGNHCVIDEIIYYDYNLNRSHNNGVPHWNQETRIKTISSCKTYSDSPYHIIDNSSEIKISLIKNNQVKNSKVIKRK